MSQNPAERKSKISEMSYNRDREREDAVVSSFLHPTSSSSSSPIPYGDTDTSYLVDPTTSASGSFQNEGLLSCETESEFGFYRNDWNQSPLVATVNMYDRHLFLCYKNPKVWPPHVEAAEFDRLPRLLSAALLANKNALNKQTRLTICEGHDGTETSNGDVLIFPDMIRYRRLTHFDVDTFVEEVLVKDAEWQPGTPERLTGSYVFVCSHGSRDRRCGVCGPALVTRFKEDIDAWGLQNQVSVSPCSHIGGHKYAGNVIIFSSSSDGKVTGHWYGYVTPDDVPFLLEQHIGKGEIIDRLWRGQMGLSEEDQKRAQELRLQLGTEVATEKHVGEQMQIYDTINTGNGAQAEVAGCCHGNGNTSCCQNSLLTEKVESNDLFNENEAKMATNKKKSSDKKITRTTSGRGSCARKVCAMPTWFESWECEDTYAALSVMGAIVSVAFAYSSYKQLRT